MNILFNYMGIDGAGRLIALSLARSFQKNGAQVYAVLSNGLPGNDDWINDFGSDRVYLVTNYKNKNKLDFFLKTVAFYAYETRKITNYFKGITFDFSLRPMYHHWADLADKAVQHKAVVTICHNPQMHSDEKPYFRLLYKNHIMNSDGIVVLTKSYIDIVNQEYGFPLEKIKYVPLGLLDAYANYTPHEVEPPYQRETINFLFFGLIRGYKGLRILARAFREVTKKRDNVTLRIVGAGDLTEYKDDFQDIPNVFFDNRYIDDSEVSSYFTGPNVVVVLPYVDACQSGVIPIAYLYENPVIASDVNVLVEQLDNGNAGIFFKARDVQDLLDKMIAVIDNPQLREQQSILMRRQREKLDWNNIGKELLCFMDESL